MVPTRALENNTDLVLVESISSAMPRADSLNISRRRDLCLGEKAEIAGYN